MQIELINDLMCRADKRVIIFCFYLLQESVEVQDITWVLARKLCLHDLCHYSYLVFVAYVHQLKS